MNYLAHAYLSYNIPHILVGNMVSDFVKGKQQFGYAVSVQKGIQLHRAIDSFTDAHPATARAKEIFRSHYRLYSAPITDILFDHYLANDATVFSDSSLYAFTQGVYKMLEEETAHLPQQFVTVLTYMKMENWLYHYRSTDGMQKSLRGLVRRANFIHDSTIAFELFLLHYKELKSCYEALFPDVKQMAKQKLGEILEEF